MHLYVRRSQSCGSITYMKKSIIYTAVFAILILLIIFGYYAISPLFRHIKVDEQAPVSTSVIKDSQIIIGTSGHPASGTVRIIKDRDTAYIRYENFKTINGPDVYIYLANDLDAKDFISVGQLKATEGNVNYEIPAGIDVGKYRYIMMWCKQFGVLFNYADISQK